MVMRFRVVVVSCGLLVLTACGGAGKYGPAYDMQSVAYKPSATIAVDRTEFPDFEEGGIQLVTEHPVSTFSVDVDTSSYGVMRSYLNQGLMPPAAAIRKEELINYFDYAYPLPEDKSIPFRPSVTVIDSPWSKNKKLLHIGLQGYDMVADRQPDSNLVFLIDVSGSMSADNKLPLVKKSIGLLLGSLKPTDTISLVVYAGASGVVLEPTAVKHKRKIAQALNSLRAGGSTAGGEGLALAYSLAKENFNAEAVNRILLATDGDFNVGAVSNADLKLMVEQNRDAGIYLSVLGFGQGNYQDDMMQTIAQNGNGTAAYIDTLQEAKKVLLDEATSTLFPIADDVKIQVEFNPKVVAEYRLIGYETRELQREDFNNDRVDAGEIGAGHSVTALYELSLVGSGSVSMDSLRYQPKMVDATTKDDELAFLKIRYKRPNESESNLLEVPIAQTTTANAEANFAAAVSAFGQLLAGGKYMNGYTFDDVEKLAVENKGVDHSGYRSEFIQLVGLVKVLGMTAQLE